MDSTVQRMIQIGTVTAVNKEAFKVRVKFPESQITSDWLSVLSNIPHISIESASLPDALSHNHQVFVAPWLPKVNDTVLVLYLPVFNSDGFVIGGI